MIAVDEESILFGEGRHVMPAAGEFVDKLTPIDRVALMALPTGRYVDFTSDHDRVRRAVGGMSGLGSPPQSGGLEFGNLLARRQRTGTVLHGIESILEGMRGVEGPKALVWISGGFAIDGAVLGLKKMAELAAASRTTLYVFMLDEPLIDSSRSQTGGSRMLSSWNGRPMRGCGSTRRTAACRSKA